MFVSLICFSKGLENVDWDWLIEKVIYSMYIQYIYVHLYMCIHMCTYIHTHICTYIYMFIYI